MATSGNTGRPVDDAECCHDRDRHERDHPARVDQGLDQFCRVEGPPRDGTGREEVEITGQKKRRQRGDDVGEEEDAEEADQDHAEQLASEERPEIRDVAEVAKDSGDDA